MSRTIREKRMLTFNFKIITPKIIRNLSDIIEKEVQSLTEDRRNDFYILYTVDTRDNTSFESQSNEIFKENQILENRIVQKITMHFYTYDNSKSIEIQIVHSVKDENLQNFIKVSGDETIWVNGVLVRLSEILDWADNQIHIKYSNYIILPLLIIFNIEFYRLILMNPIFDANLCKLLFAVVFIISIHLSTKFPTYIQNLWPSIEIQTGLDHQNSVKKGRNKLFWILTSIILPLLLALIYDLIKSFF
ncbi:hypothetical protein [Flavobacterium inviolabile]|uniref:hypothetical protein n=1 Tax=Flavobacterium inviolabile TaxID=2748320 RepID=UPI0015AF3DF4|nr:hypothetical protein [Flavobacterium inviolabile]